MKFFKGLKSQTKVLLVIFLVAVIAIAAIFIWAQATGRLLTKADTNTDVMSGVFYSNVSDTTTPTSVVFLQGLPGPVYGSGISLRTSASKVSYSSDKGFKMSYGFSQIPSANYFVREVNTAPSSGWGCGSQQILHSQVTSSNEGNLADVSCSTYSTVTGRVVDADTNQPIANAGISFRLASAEPYLVKPYPHTITDSSGAYTIGSVPDTNDYVINGMNNVTVVATGYGDNSNITNFQVNVPVPTNLPGRFTYDIRLKKSIANARGRIYLNNKLWTPPGERFTIQFLGTRSGQTFNMGPAMGINMDGSFSGILDKTGSFDSITAKVFKPYGNSTNLNNATIRDANSNKINFPFTIRAGDNLQLNAYFTYP